MNELINAGYKRMTVREVAYALKVDESTVRRHIKAIRDDSGNVAGVEHGKTTYMSEAEVTEIKRRIERSGRNDLANVVQVREATTSLEIEEMTLKVIAYHRAEADRLRAELADAAPKIEAHAALMRSDRNMSITDAAKHFGLHPKTQVFPYLRERGYLTSLDLPTQAAIDAGYLQLRETHCPDGSVRAQAVVPVASLDIWRLRVVPQIAAWAAQ